MSEYTDADAGEFYTNVSEAFAEEMEDVYRMPDTWEDYAKLVPVLDDRLASRQKRTG